MQVFRFPPDLVAAIVKVARRRQMSRTELVEEAIKLNLQSYGYPYHRWKFKPEEIKPHVLRAEDIKR
jgi:hypothetical protein